MKALSTIVFGAATLLFATFANTAPAAASDVGFSIHIGRGYDDGYYHRYRRPCLNRWYRRHHPYECYRYRYHSRYDRRRDYGFNDYWYWHRRNHPYCHDRRPHHRHSRW